jgi:5'-nucleotidase
MTSHDLTDISTLLLDMDGTLLDLHFDDFFWNEYLCRRYAEIHNTPAEEANEHVFETLQAEEGNLNWYCTDHWSQKLRLDILALKEELVHLIKFRPGSQEFLDRLARSDIRVILVTNAHPDVVNLKHTHTGLLDLIPDHVTSHQYGAPKESDAFWCAFSESYDLKLPTTMMIDDSVAVLRAAKSHGIGHQIAVSQPNSQKQSQPTTDFPTVNNLSTLDLALAS